MTADYEIDCLDSMQKAIERYQIIYSGHLFFRGEARQFPSVAMPGILRDDGFLAHEADFYNDLKNMHQSELLRERDYIDKLALMQHYGAPTRLIDMTINPYVALYFACESGLYQNEPGYVYMYLQDPINKTDPAVRLLSWMACNKWNDFNEVCKNYQIQYAEPIDTEKAKLMIEMPLFICGDDFKDSSNKRIIAQQGTFAICGEKVASQGNSIVTIDSIPVILTLRIPAEFKKKIIDELEEYGINTETIYLDFSSASNYLKDKYKKSTNEIDDNDYSVIISDRGNTAYRRSKDIRIIMKKGGSIDYIHSIAKYEIEKISQDVDVVWAYVAMSHKDYVIDNYRVRMMWVNPLWKYKDKFSPQQFKIIGDGGYSWEDSVGTSIISDFDEINLFSDSDAYIYVSAFALYEKAKKIFNNLLKIWESGDVDKFSEMLVQYDNALSWINEQWDITGLPDDKDVVKYLNNFDEIFIDLQTLSLLLKKDNYKLLIDLQFTNIKKGIVNIESGKDHWRSKIQLSDEEISEIVPLTKTKERRIFRQTIPASKDALNVKIDALGRLDKNGLLTISCKTNLFDGAILMAYVKKDHRPVGSTKAIVKQGEAVFQNLGKRGEIYSGQSVEVEITLPVSATQDIEFVKKAGIQYEKLAGDFIVRTGTAPVGEYQKIITIS